MIHHQKPRATLKHHQQPPSPPKTIWRQSSTPEVKGGRIVTNDSKKMKPKHSVLENHHPPSDLKTLQKPTWSTTKISLDHTKKTKQPPKNSTLHDQIILFTLNTQKHHPFHQTHQLLKYTKHKLNILQYPPTKIWTSTTGKIQSTTRASSYQKATHKNQSNDP